MLKIVFVSFLALALVSLPIAANSTDTYEKAFKELCLIPVSQLDFKIQQLEDRTYRCNKGLQVSFEDDYYSGFNFGFSDNIRVCNAVICYKDDKDSKIVVCEVIVDIKDDFGAKAKVNQMKFIYDTVLNIAKSTIHPSFDKCHLRLIIKRVKPLKVESEEAARFCDDPESFLLSYTSEEEVLVIWDNGVPHYQDAFFAE